MARLDQLEYLAKHPGYSGPSETIPRDVSDRLEAARAGLKEAQAARSWALPKNWAAADGQVDKMTEAVADKVHAKRVAFQQALTAAALNPGQQAPGEIGQCVEGLREAIGEEVNIAEAHKRHIDL
jgi:hypothetical protein